MHVYEVSGDFEVRVLILGFTDQEKLASIIEVELVFKVWREEVWHASFVDQTLWESLDIVFDLPSYSLTIVLMLILIVLFILSVFVQVDSDVHSANEIVDDLHQSLRVSTQPESLNRCRVNIPVKLPEFVPVLGFNQREQEVKPH